MIKDRKDERCILVITSTNDLTIDYITRKHPDVPFFRFNLDQFSKYDVSINDSGFQARTSDGKEISTATCKSVYYRKPFFEDLSDVIDPQYHNFVHRETYALIEGIAETFNGPCLSRPSVLRRADNKILQLFLAKKCGFNIPKSLITNSAQSLHNFGMDGAIVKPVASGTVTYAGKKEFVQTNIVNPETDLKALPYSPCYFQEYIDKDYEVRVTVVDQDITAVRIDSEDNIDWRKPGNNPVYSLYQLPENIEKLCLKILASLELKFGCIDLLVKDDEFYFLEVNANGQWGWLEIELDLKISDAILRYLQ